MKKIFFNIIVVALASTSSIGFTSCNKNDKEVDLLEVSPDLIMGIWHHYDDLNYCGIKFSEDGTYSFEDQNRNVNGIYGITERKKMTHEDTGRPYYLYKMLVSGSDEFDQLWVRYSFYGFSTPSISVSFYSNNEQLFFYSFDR